jgi:hypothetical protein
MCEDILSQIKNVVSRKEDVPAHLEGLVYFPGTTSSRGTTTGTNNNEVSSTTVLKKQVQPRQALQQRPNLKFSLFW